MSIRSLRVGRAYRDLCRAAQQTFSADFAAQRALRDQTRRTLRLHVDSLSDDAMVEDLRSGTNMIRYEIVQASYQQGSDTYRAHIMQDHLSHGEVLELQEPPDPSTLKQPKK
mmetsp:Transcript_15038/g.29039  ORF Transcript_15038/g.29039 Transcript_15038/m.29039 type:complete len:112 (-) Transcript_15038:66-401(-)